MSAERSDTCVGSDQSDIIYYISAGSVHQPPLMSGGQRLAADKLVDGSPTRFLRRHPRRLSGRQSPASVAGCVAGCVTDTAPDVLD